MNSFNVLELLTWRMVEEAKRSPIEVVLQLIRSKQRFGDILRIRTGNPNDSDAALSGGRGNGCDGGHLASRGARPAGSVCCCLESRPRCAAVALQPGRMAQRGSGVFSQHAAMKAAWGGTGANGTGSDLSPAGNQSAMEAPP